MHVIYLKKKNYNNNIQNQNINDIRLIIVEKFEFKLDFFSYQMICTILFKY